MVDRTEDEIRSTGQKVEAIKQAITHGAGLRVLRGKRLGLAYCSDLSDQSLRQMAVVACELARHNLDDPCLNFSEPLKKHPEMAIIDDLLEEITLEEKIETILGLERAAFAHDKRIVSSDYVRYGDVITETTLANSRGLDITYRASSISIGGAFIAEDDGVKQMGWDGQVERFWRRLNPSEVGIEAAKRAVGALNGKPVPSGVYQVVLEPVVAIKVVEAIARAVNGESIRLGRSFLCGKMGKQIASSLVSVTDDGTREDWVGSSPVDDEGSGTMSKDVVRDGVLLAYLYDLYTAKKAETETTGNARRAFYGSNPVISPTNFYMVPGHDSRQELIEGVSDGLLATGSIGFHINPTTGDFSIGVSGRWIRGGKLTDPVGSVTIASNLCDILTSIDGVGDDLVPVHGGMGSPTIRLSRMTVAGA
jgi:PmbA protein